MRKFFFPLFAWIASVVLLPTQARAVYTDANADAMFAAFNQMFYKRVTGTSAYYAEDTAGGRAWFWGQANMIEMVSDTYDRAPNQDRRTRMASLCRGFTDYHGQNWAWNEYNDDIIWAVIVFAKTYRATNDQQFLNQARENFDVVWNRAWATNQGGGLYWMNTSGSRNACVNAPAAIAACILYEITGNVVYLDKAKSIIAWMDATLMNPSGAVDDHITSSGARNGWRFTYNQGTYVGACSALYRLTGQVSYLENAIKAARYTRDSMCNAAGIFPDHGSTGDGSGFNGIGIRWIARMAKDQGLWDEFYPWLKANADAAWTNRRTADNLSWANWRAATPAPPQTLVAFGCYGSVVALQVVPSVDPSFTPDLQGPNPSAVYEAENATLNGAVSATNIRGFRGAGFADFGTEAGESITWTVPSAVAGNHWISFRYGNGGTAPRALSLRVNGSVIQSVPFEPTGAWTTWSHNAGISVPLLAGSNTIQLLSTTGNGPNIDLLYLSAMPAAPPAGATILFDGTQPSLAGNWKRGSNGSLPNWTVSHEALGVVREPQANDISTIRGFKDFSLHLEWLAPPGGLGQEGANSGVKLQGMYEIQILNTPRGQTPMLNGAGAILGRKAPSSNASTGAGHWQTYDIDFTAARWNGSAKIADARVTVRWNGMVVQDNVALTSPTDSSQAELPGWHPVVLQAEASAASSPVRFRNVWVTGDSFAAPSALWNGWLNQTALTGQDRGASQDPDGDGVPNLWEYATGGNPMLADIVMAGGESRTQRLSLVEDAGGNFGELTFIRVVDHEQRGLTFSAESSTTLDPGDWTPRTWTLSGAPEPIGDGSLERVKVRVNVPLAEEPHAFIRLRVDVAE